MFEYIKNRNVILVGSLEEKRVFLEQYPSFQHVENKTENGRDCYIVMGDEWKEKARNLERGGAILWKDIYPDWAEKLIHGGKYFVFEEIKKYSKNNVDKMADIFEYISQYKKIAMVYGNCQSLYISMLLEESVLSEEYIFCRMPLIQKIVDEKNTGFAYEYMSKTDLFIYQIARRDNVFGEKLSTDEIKKLLKKDAVKVSIPFVYFNAYFPQYIRNCRNDAVERGEGHVPYGDSKIQLYLEQGMDEEHIETELLSESLFSEQEIWDNYGETVKELGKRECDCDIKILDYIVANYTSEYLFYTPSHPTNKCLAELANRILERLNYVKRLEEEQYAHIPQNDKYQIYIYPSVRQSLHLVFEKKTFYIERECYREQNNYTLKNYILDYKKFCFPEFKEYIYRDFRTINIKHILSLNASQVEERRAGVFEISGNTIHLSLYLTVISDRLEGNIFEVYPNYAPMQSFVFPVFEAGTNKVFPCTIYANGVAVIRSQSPKGRVLMVDVIWLKKMR